MASPLIEATTKLTEGQWRNLLRRVLKKEGGKLTESAAEEILQHEPPVTRQLGTLYAPHPNPSLAEEGVRVPERYPIDQARAKYFEDPERYLPGGSNPPVKEVSQVPMGSPEDLAAGISYARNEFKPILTPSIQRGMGAVNKDVQAQGAEGLLAGRGMTPGDIRTTPQQFVKSEGLDVPTPELKTVLENVNQADRIWKEMAGGAQTPEAQQLMIAQSMGHGGSRTPQTMATQLWKRLLELQSAGVKNTFKSPKDWFMASYNRWKQNPTEFGKKHPREAGLLNRIESVYKEGAE